MNFSSAYGRAIYGQAAYGNPNINLGVPLYLPPASRTFNPYDCELDTIIITPSAVLDYAFDYAETGNYELEPGEIIATSIWTATNGLNISNPSPSLQVNDTLTVVWISGGTEGNFYLITNTVVTSGGRTMQASFTVQCVSYQTGCC